MASIDSLAYYLSIFQILIVYFPSPAEKFDVKVYRYFCIANNAAHSNKLAMEKERLYFFRYLLLLDCKMNYL